MARSRKKTKEGQPVVPQKVVDRVEASYRKRMDQLIVQQCIVRRFAIEEPAAHDELVNAREEILSHLPPAGANGNLGRILGDSLSMALVSVFELFETRRGRECIRNVDADGAMKIIGSEMMLSSPHWLLSEPEVVTELLSVLSKRLNLVNQLRGDYNYFDYFPVLSMATKASGAETFRRYRQAETGQPVRWHALSSTDELDFKFSRLFQLRDELKDIDLACALRLSGRPRSFDSSSVRVLDTNENPHLRRSAEDPRRLVLEVDLDSAPLDIDYAIDYFSKAVGSLLLEEHKRWSNVPNGGLYRRTKFAQWSDTPLLLRTVSQYSHSMLGLWMWDLIHDLKLKRTAAEDEIREALNHQSLEELPKYFLRIKGYIKPAKGEDCDLDKVIAAPYGGRLGRRVAVSEAGAVSSR
jgi:hypothetical protein